MEYVTRITIYSLLHTMPDHMRQSKMRESYSLVRLITKVALNEILKLELIRSED